MLHHAYSSEYIYLDIALYDNICIILNMSVRVYEGMLYNGSILI